VASKCMQHAALPCPCWCNTTLQLQGRTSICSWHCTMAMHQQQARRRKAGVLLCCLLLLEQRAAALMQSCPVVMSADETDCVHGVNTNACSYQTHNHACIC
jgi:hypothetical protein